MDPDDELNKQLTEYSTANERLEDENARLQGEVERLKRALRDACDQSEDLVDAINEAERVLGKVL